ncbi:hypothetical protein [Salisediminibacterium beveridgei]|uniref:Uncharacterized protein n=1 Tax=Salisediminibacterium beveridgei TaxID=632773 RepID=A0A1D7QU40_9BACI|nr:hypothetical protein [Salisediminibacterium beveridgei]AOM82533.1 hypothetical protein BBEV_1165 [Salisediminibacterium beveridgei]
MIVVYIMLTIGIGLIGYGIMKKDSGEDTDHKMENFSISLMQELERTNKRVDDMQHEIEQLKTKEMMLQEQLKYAENKQETVAQ